MKVIISGGGTGGHIYPAIAIAQQLKSQIENLEILFVGAKGKMEMEKVPAAGFPIKGLWISGIQRQQPLKNLNFPFKVLSSLMEASKIIRSFKPDIAIGVGGYASGPLLYMAARAKVPCLIQEQNSFAGLTNKWLAKKVQKICVAYDGMERFFPKDKIVITGNPVRQDILDLRSKKEAAMKHFKLNPEKKTILVVGGSQGARSMNASISQDLQKFIHKDIQLIWQTGRNSFTEHPEQEKYLQNDLLQKMPFIYEMDLGYAAADVVISRAGALAVSELCIAAKPTVFVPLPTAAEDHQTQNALALVEKQAAIMVKDHEAQANLVNTAIDLLENTEQCVLFSENIQALAKPQATQMISEEVLQLAAR